MADYTNSGLSQGAQYPENTIESPWSFTEPLITPEQLVSRHLFGIPLASAMINPMTGQCDVFTEDMVKEHILRAVAKAELESHIDIMPRQRKEKHPFDRCEWESFGYFRIKHRPVSSIDEIVVNPSSDIDLFNVPLEWVDRGLMIHGQISIIPIFPATATAGLVFSSGGGGGSTFLNILGGRAWIPSYWNITYTSGFLDGLLPRVINELIGTIAAMNILSQLASTYAATSSQSISIDSMSQSISGPGAQIFRVRYGELEDEKKLIIKKIKSMYNLKIFSGNV